MVKDKKIHCYAATSNFSFNKSSYFILTYESNPSNIYMCYELNLYYESFIPNVIYVSCDLSGENGLTNYDIIENNDITIIFNYKSYFISIITFEELIHWYNNILLINKKQKPQILNLNRLLGVLQEVILKW